MKNTRKLLILLTVLSLCLSLCAGLAGCGENGNNDSPAVSGNAVDHTVSIRTAGGMAMEGVSVAVYADEALSNLQGYGQTDATGTAKVSLTEGGKYYISLSGVPKGYAMEKFYSFNGTSASITLTSALVQGENVADAKLKLGDVMYDFTVSTQDGTEYTLSEMLKEKDMVLLNFWFSTCSPCITEFPFLDKAYQMYQEDVGVIALNSYPLDNEDSVAAFAASMGLTFPMVKVPDSWAGTFSLQGYPTSVVVDRYGVIVLIESGTLPSLRPFTSIFETLSGDDYQQKLYKSIGDIVITPKPTYDMPESDTIAEILGTTDLEISFRAEDGESGEYTWPFIEAEKNGERCLKASNQYVEESYAILYADVTLKKGEALGFDFLRSTETNGDFMYVIVDGDDINSISGFFLEEKWETCYPLVAEKDGTYEVALCYIKDAETDAGDDTVYIKNMRIVQESDIDTETYLPKEAAVSEDGFTYNYVDIVYNSKDNYYHVGSENGPLLLVDLMHTTQFNEEDSIWNMAYEGKVLVDGVDYVEQIEGFSFYANNSNLNGICPVTKELYDLLQIVDTALGFDEADDKEWLKACKYYQVYGSSKQLEDPIKGLAPFCAYTAKQGKNIETNKFTYNRQIIPRGLFAEFVPSRSGVYRITSRNEAQNGVLGWIFNADKEILFDTDKNLERTFDDIGEISMVYYMEAGKPYYINIAFCDPGQLGDVYYDIEYVGSSYQYFISCSPGAYSYDTDATGTAMNYTIAPGIDVVLGEDGIYYHDLGDGKKGSKIYLDLVNSTPAIPNGSLSTVGDFKGVIDRGQFDFSKTEEDEIVLEFLKRCDGDETKAIALMRQEWADGFDTLYKDYKVQEVFAGTYHGEGEDYTEIMRQFEKQMIQSGPAELRGCVVVTEELAEILQKYMDKWAFKGVETSWRKLCYYYQPVG